MPSVMLKHNLRGSLAARLEAQATRRRMGESRISGYRLTLRAAMEEPAMAGTPCAVGRRAFLKTAVAGGLAAVGRDACSALGGGGRAGCSQNAEPRGPDRGQRPRRQRLSGAQALCGRGRPGDRRSPRGHQAEQRGSRQSACHHSCRLHRRHSGVSQVDRQGGPGGDRRVARSTGRRWIRSRTTAICRWRRNTA